MRALIVLLSMMLGCVPSALAAPKESFSNFIQSFRAEAVQAGIKAGTYDAVMGGVTPVKNIPGLVTSQPEFTTPMWVYINKRVSKGRIARGRKALQRHEALFQSIGRRFGVDPYVLGAIWGIESDYGAVLGNKKLIKPIVPALATLVHQRRGRVEADAAELIVALRLIQDHGWTKQSLIGSWAGAIGHTQLIVSGLLAHGTDGDGDGAVNPHTSLADALATSAVYLKALGYRPGLDWGFEVDVPAGFDYAIATRNEMKRVGFFAERGVRRVKGRTFSDLEQPVFLYVPAGQNGPKFLMTPNYLVLKGYNFSDSYALSVAHLTDRLKGSGPFVSSWPTHTKFPNLKQRTKVQQWLKQLGFYQGEIDGRIGPISQEAYQRFQAQRGLVADGYITVDAYHQLKAATGN